MGIAVDQPRLRQIIEALLPTRNLERSEAITILQFVQLAVGVDSVEDPIEHSIVQSIAQRVTELAGLRVGDIQGIPPLDDDRARLAWFQRLGRQLPSRETRELTYALIFLTCVADLRITPAEREALEEFQQALGIEQQRATDLIVLITEIVATSGTM